jgi:ubiquinol-cytochrome c reductase cytochrome b subunit
MEIIRGDYNVSDITLNRFFALHVVAIPLILLGIVVAHIIALHEVGSNNPDGIDIKKLKDDNGNPKDGVTFHPYYTVKDSFGLVFFLIIFSIVLFYFPTMGGYFLEAPNFDPANELVTPEHIAPVWYFTPFYAILRAVPDKLAGVIAMGVAVVIFFFLPWLDRSKVRSIWYRGIYYKIALTLFVISFIILGYLGMEVPTPGKTLAAQVCSFIYFSFFFLMPIYTTLDKNKAAPQRLT